MTFFDIPLAPTPGLPSLRETDLVTRAAQARGRIIRYRAWLSVLFLDRRDQLKAMRNARARGKAPYAGTLNDVEDSIKVHWRLLNETRRERDRLEAEIEALSIHAERVPMHVALAAE